MEVERLINEGVSYEEIGRQYGCTGSNIKKVALRLGIELKARRTVNENETFNIQQQFAAKQIGACPFCGTENPGWLVREEWKLLGSNEYYFKCPHCETELMVLKDDVTGMAFTKNTPSGRKKASEGKIMNVPYVTVVKIGLSAKTHENILLQGEDMPVRKLKQMMEELRKK